MMCFCAILQADLHCRTPHRLALLVPVSWIPLSVAKVYLEQKALWSGLLKRIFAG